MSQNHLKLHANDHVEVYNYHCIFYVDPIVDEGVNSKNEEF